MTAFGTAQVGVNGSGFQLLSAVKRRHLGLLPKTCKRPKLSDTENKTTDRDLSQKINFTNVQLSGETGAALDRLIRNDPVDHWPICRHRRLSSHSERYL